MRKPTLRDIAKEQRRAISLSITDHELIAQMVHQAYHHAEGDTWRTCPLASCTRARDAIEALAPHAKREL